MCVEATARTPTRAMRRRIVLVAAAVAVVDWASKLVTSAMLDDRSVELGVIDLRLAHNRGVAFSVAAGAPSWLVLSVSSVVVCVVAAAAWRGALGGALAGGLIVGGAVANVVDRAVDGSVVDMLDLGWWPTFNLADTALTIGIALLLVRSLSARPRPASR